MFSQDSASLKCLHTHCNHCWQLISTDAAYIIIGTVTSKRRLKEPISAQGTSMFPLSSIQGRSSVHSVRIDVIFNTMLHVPMTQVTFSLRTSNLTLNLRFEYIVITQCIVALYNLQIYILQPHFTFCNFTFWNSTFCNPTLHFAVLSVLVDQQYVIAFEFDCISLSSYCLYEPIS